MAIRLFDVMLALVLLVLLCPLLLAAALGIALASPGPILYRARRVGLDGQVFTMFKFRTMHVAQAENAGVITAKNDARVFPLGRWLRRFKIDELPQLYHVLRGDMALVGPRPEDPEIVDRYYTPLHRETLRVLPGLASPGSIYNYTHGEDLLQADEVEKAYLTRLLPVKLALDIVYVREASLGYNLRIIGRTIGAISSKRRRAPKPPELERGRALIQPVDTTFLRENSSKEHV